MSDGHFHTGTYRGRTYIETPYSDTNPAPPLHDAVGCIEWCAHCALCGEPVLYGARCREHYGVYPLGTGSTEQEQR